MKTTQRFILALMAIALALVGCKKEGSAQVQTSQLESTFAATDSSLKASADKAVAAIKKSDFAGALAELKSLAANAKLTESQKQAVNDVIAQIQKVLSDGINKAADGANKAINDAQKKLTQ